MCSYLYDQLFNINWTSFVFLPILFQNLIYIRIFCVNFEPFLFNLFNFSLHCAIRVISNVRSYFCRLMKSVDPYEFNQFFIYLTLFTLSANLIFFNLFLHVFELLRQIFWRFANFRNLVID